MGHDIRKEEVKISKETIRNVKEFARSRNKKELQSFLGLINWTADL